MSTWTTTCNLRELYKGHDEQTAKFAYETAIRALESAGFEAWDEGNEESERTDLQTTEYTSLQKVEYDDRGEENGNYATVTLTHYLQ